MLPALTNPSSLSAEQEICKLEEKYAAAFKADAQFDELKSIRQSIKLLKAQISEQPMPSEHG